MRFDQLNLDPRVMQGIEDAGFVECTPVQEQTYHFGMQGKDVCVQSQTGTGKTAAFLVTVFQNKCTGLRTGMAMVIVPTRELAVQIEDEARLLGSPLNLKIACVYGGVGYKKQEESLQAEPDLIIGTPGRLIDFGKNGKLAFDKVSTLIIDEADRLFDMGFMPDLRYMLKKMPPITERMTMLFSATLSSRVRQLAWEYMNNPGEVEISPENITVEQISQELYHVSKTEKLSLLLGLLKRDRPENAIIFTNTKHMAVELAWRLSENGYKAQYIMGDLPQKKRLQVIQKLKNGELPFLVATDVAARGLHINDLSMVVNYDIPEDFENYVHRIGRTARAGKSGKAVTLACEKYVYGLEAIENYINMRIPVYAVSDDLFAADASAGKVFHDPDKPARGRERRGGERGPGGPRKSYAKGGRGPERSPSQGNSQGAPAGRPKRTPDGPKPKAGSEKSRGPARNNPGPVRNASGPVRDKKPQAAGNPPVQKPKPASNLDDRLAYYRKKYGEDFQFPAGQVQEAPSQKEGFLKRLFKGFKKKNE